MKQRANTNTAARQDRPTSLSWRVTPVVLVAVLGVGLTLVDAYLRTDAASGLVGGESLPDSPATLTVVLVLAQAAALWLRYRRPIAVLVAVSAVDVVLLALSSGTLSVGSVAVSFAAYSVFRWRSGASVYLATGLAALVSTLVAWAFHEPDASTPAGWELPFAALRSGIVYLVPALIAELVASRARAMVVLRERAELAERERERSAADAVQRERALMARELHDIAAHHLSGIIVGAQAAGALVAAEPERAREYIRTVARDAQLTLANLRQTVGLLRSDDRGELAPAPSIAQIPDLLESLRASGMEIAEEWLGDPVALGPVAETAAYRMVQESLANARQHAPGAACTVRVEVTPTATEISVTNARPVSRVESPALGGHGLIGMRERAALTGARLDTGPTPDGGWRNELTLPMPDPNDDPRDDPNSETRDE
ncbi:sensor histidine kinase [Conyzicola nivalis]|uniref:histidine kinase n=1 Tax=Conyzicola nivalis TaxID=1477021 RepID=A0A916WJ97_9MICO|nr:histidine kinase [Conyzicola nivalis]GGB03103.1 two-component sensor histidine kinase [Conyzicola nivalis]